MKYQYYFLLLLLMLSCGAYAQPSCVILIHGLARTANSMNALEHRLSQKDFLVINVDYPSRKHDIDKLASLAIKPALAKCPKNHSINFVTHSLGGILVRQYLSKNTLDQLNRVVMLGPPNKGSEVVDKLKEIPGFHFLNGNAGLQLGTGKASVPNSLGEANYELGIIAGTKSVNWILSTLIPNTDDGKVSVESTKLDGMSDHIEMPVTHTFMMNNKKVITQVINFLESGNFNRD